MKIISRALYIWLVLAVITTLMCGLVYVAVQQSFRQSANDPQIQLSQDAASLLNTGVTPEAIKFPQLSVSDDVVNLQESLAPFFLIADENGKTVAGNGFLNGELPDLPIGVYDFVKNHGEDRVTWQPQADVREAAVVTSYKNGDKSGYVVVGRSLREVEARESQLRQEVLLAWFVAVSISLVLLLVGASLVQKEKTHHHELHQKS